MTKKEIIQTVQQLEAKAFLQVKLDEKEYGIDSVITRMSRTKWCGMNEMMKKLGIKYDDTLSENQEAIQLIIGMVNIEREK